MSDLVIRGATVVDGLGHEPRRADLAVKDGRIEAVGEIRDSEARTIDAGGLVLSPGIVDVHTHYDAQATWDPTLSPSPSLGVTTAVIGNCGFGIVPAPPAARDLVIRNLSVVEGMDLDALRAGIRWEFESFGEYMDMLRRRPAYANLAVLAGHSTIRTAIMGEAASQRADATPEELARMKAMVADAMAQGAIGLGASYSLNHSGYGGVPMPSTIAPLSELDALVGAMGPRGQGVIAIASGVKTPEELEPIAAKHGRPFFQGTGMAMYNEQEPERALRIFDACAAALRRGNGLYVQIPCQPLSFDFTMANAYPFYSHSAFDPIKAYSPEQLKAVFRDPSWRARFRDNAKNPRPGMIFQGNWERVMVAVVQKPANASYVNRYLDEIAAEEKRDPLDVMLDLALDENLETAFLGRFLNVGDEGVARLLKHEAGVVALSDAGAHLIYMCDAGFGLHFLAHWVRERGDFDLAEGVRRLTSHPADLYGIRNRGRIAVGAQADLLLFDPATVGVSPAERVADLPGGGRRTIRRPTGVHGVFCNGVMTFDGKDYVRHTVAPGHVLDRFNASRGSHRAIAAQ
ncbi:amidohydrolase family protein [Enhydrobacter sp.]|jgi:N-acyl-D-aspartate/D-glutamate deacylase|uniref:N-acyl-D-amino-acid deacylase family protein n=1 Tax=Enhydrobacter sp. TaxID=1894999 RepID=UPI0026184034|nr:amidohydrolase family protein [Enhydrobacter sp.]WIM11135.1 MAG: amidohydrolase family protein [Enhydrobacter sp.]